MSLTRLLWLCITACALWPSPSHSASLYTDKYDRQIEAAAKLYLPGIPWRLGKAQLFQESRLEPAAVSPVGAAGLGQFMPATWREVSKAMGFGIIDRQVVGPMIQAWGYYMRQMRQRWRMPDMERHKFALGGYNAGNGNIGRASRLCEFPDTWDALLPCLPEVTGPKNTRETTGYVVSIFRWFKLLEARL